MNSRQSVFNLLLKVYKNSAYSNLALDACLSELNAVDENKAFITALFYGVIERQITLDYQLSQVLKKPIKKLRPEVHIILRMGVYQLFFSNKVPAGAAVNESVKLAKKNRCAYAAGLINASLRACKKNGLLFPGEDEKNYLSVKHSVSQHIIDLWINDYGYDVTLGILSALDESTKTTLRVNTLKTTRDGLIKALSKEGVSAEESALNNNALNISGYGNLTGLTAYGEGLFHVQDIASQLCAEALNAQKGDKVLDICSAPGGKAFTIAELMTDGEIVACDKYASRVRLIKDGADRLGINFITPCVNDALKFNEKLGLFERVLCDVPCSGLGVMSKKPEIRYKSLEDIKNSALNQQCILDNAFRYLKTGGTLVYSTCSLNKAENEDVINAFKEKNEAVQVLSLKTFFPHVDGTDGFFIAVLKKV